MDNNKRRYLFVIFIIYSAFILCGCATARGSGAGPVEMIGALVSLPFHVLGLTFELINKLPKPPPGVFF